MSKVVICLWFDDQAEEAANYYVETFKNAKINRITKYPKAAERDSGKPAGSVMTVDFEVEGQAFLGLNGGKLDAFKFNGATSFIVNCEDQAEIDHLWERLSAVPEAEQCGWCIDKFGVTWQITPKVLDEMMNDPDQDKVERVTACFMPMKKLDIAKLQEAYDGN